MLQHIYLFLKGSGLAGWQLDAASGFVFAVILLSVIPVTGSMVRRFAVWQVDFLSAFTGVRPAEFICNRLLFLGTVVHELSHALFAALSGARVLKVRCLTLFSRDTLGYVRFATRGGMLHRSFQLAFTGCAPTVTGLCILSGITVLWKHPGISVIIRIFLVYFGISVADHMSMSSQDVKNYIRGCPLLFVSVFACAAGFCRFCLV